MKNLILMAVIVLSSPAAAHEAMSGFKYPFWCCNGDRDGKSGDCQKIPASSVHITRDGYVIALSPGDHRLVTYAHRMLVPYGSERPSEDGETHLCLYPNEDTPRCLFLPPNGF